MCIHPVSKAQLTVFSAQQGPAAPCDTGSPLEELTAWLHSHGLVTADVDSSHHFDLSLLTHRRPDTYVYVTAYQRVVVSLLPTQR